jgi:hypothetical protein
MGEIFYIGISIVEVRIPSDLFLTSLVSSLHGTVSDTGDSFHINNWRSKNQYGFLNHLDTYPAV